MNEQQQKQLNNQIDTMMGEIQMKDMVRMYNSLVERCFHGCAKDFTVRAITDQEELCMIRCTDKYLRHSARVARVFAEQSVLQQQQLQEKV